MSYSDIDLDIQEIVSDNGLTHLQGATIEEIREMRANGEISVFEGIVLQCVSPDWLELKEYYKNESR